MEMECKRRLTRKGQWYDKRGDSLERDRDREMERLKEKERAKAHHQWHPPSHASRQRSHLTTASKHKPHSFRFPREGVCLRLGSSPPPRAAHTATINTRTCNVVHVLINSSRTHRVIISASITITQERESTRSLLCLYLSRLPYRAHSHTHTLHQPRP